MAYTVEELKAIHVALETTGNIGRAAKLLGMDHGSLSKIVKSYPELRSYLKDAKPPTEAEMFAGPAQPEIITTTAPATDMELASAVKRVDKAVRNGFEGLGLTKAQTEEAMAFYDFGKDHFAAMRHTTGGGIMKVFFGMMGDIDQTRKQIESAELDDIELQRMLREDRSRMVKLTLEAYDRIREAGLTAAVIEAKKREAAQTKNKAQPGFAPLLMKVDGNVTVQEGKADVTKEAGSNGAG